ncbi:MAG: Rap1a/Tai family immunity protein [Pseudomonadota bacterium]
MRLKLSLYSAIGLACCLNAAQAASPTVDDFAALKENVRTGDFGARAQWTGLTFYLEGAMAAIGSAQTRLEKTDAATLFCPPRGQSLTMQDVYAMLDAAPKGADTPVATAIMAALQARFPCKS